MRSASRLDDHVEQGKKSALPGVRRPGSFGVLATREHTSHAEGGWHSRLRAVVLEWSRTRKRYEHKEIWPRPRLSSRLKRSASKTQTAASGSANGAPRARRRLTVNTSMALPQGYLITTRAVLLVAQGESRNTPAANTAGRSDAPRRQSNSIRTQSAWPVAAAVRHEFTNYDGFLLAGHDREEARSVIREKVEGVLNAWRSGSASKDGACAGRRPG